MAEILPGYFRIVCKAALQSSATILRFLYSHVPEVKKTGGKVFTLQGGQEYTLPVDPSAHVAIPLGSSGYPTVEVTVMNQGSLVYLRGNPVLKCSREGMVSSGARETIYESGVYIVNYKRILTSYSRNLIFDFKKSYREDYNLQTDLVHYRE
ncbi:uncharacterized protein RSE6_05886 [Rhynchosporium secalis]|uniref:Uncharacterized protein n=1 Tax=Rhynchosporium secalis TaxID=38038 RepID=A0A1E1M915_RHYSE|nr:uncharacterized protein RSE6_05886 [Rhynchosporium secalis]